MASEHEGQGWAVPLGVRIPRPDPEHVEAVRRAKELGRAAALIRADEEDWKRERLRRTKDAAQQAATLEWLSLGGAENAVPGVELVQPPAGDDPFPAPRKRL